MTLVWGDYDKTFLSQDDHFVRRVTPTAGPRLIRKHCELDSEGAGFLEQAMTGQNFSARAHDRILKVARTLADLAGSEKISGNQILEAINFRTRDRAMWC